MNASQGVNLNLLETYTHELIHYLKLCYVIVESDDFLQSFFSGKTIILFDNKMLSLGE